MTHPPERHTPLGAGVEFDVVRRLEERWGALAVGIGDDAAVMEVPRGERLVASTDASIDGVHFRPGWLSWREIGYRAVTAALSDLAAMAASPVGVLVSIAVPRSLADKVDEIADGIGDAVGRAGALIRGGNLAVSDTFSITTTVFGSAMTPLRRGGARVGHLLYVSGRLGGPAAAVRAFEAGRDPVPAHRERFARPVARIAEARWLAARGASAAIDISDGLWGDAGHLAMASGVAFEASLLDLPVVDGVSASEEGLGGEEYELLVTTPRPFPTAEFAERFGIPLTLIGHAVAGEPRVTFFGDRNVAGLRSYDHFSR